MLPFLKLCVGLSAILVQVQRTAVRATTEGILYCLTVQRCIGLLDQLISSGAETLHAHA